ncbi:MAG: hypothetical protein HC915_19400 [Anaerolineae bacterium]|nr:hypothetical protein [Anaerolineae bacterium]
MNSPSTLVLALGNPLRGDDGIGAAVLDALRDVDYRNIINMPFVPGMDFDEVRPYLRLSENLGRAAARAGTPSGAACGGGISR